MKFAQRRNHLTTHICIPVVKRRVSVLCTGGVATMVLTLSVTWADSTRWRDVLCNLASN